MKAKIRFVQRKIFQNQMDALNLFVDSMLPYDEALKQYNGLTELERKSIVQSIKQYDKIRNEKLHSVDNGAQIWQTSGMVDAHIIATEHNIDPLVVVMCRGMPKKSNEKIIVKD